MAHPAHQYALHKAATKPAKTAKTVDALAYAVGIGGNIAIIPQIVVAWESNAPGLAVTTWLLFIAVGLVWLVYAIQHKQRPLIVAQSVGISCNLAVVLGWTVNNLLR